MGPVKAVTHALATYRLTKLVIDDEVTRELREKAYAALEKHQGNPVADKLTYFLSCPWCVSIWSAAVLYALYHFAPETHDVLSTSLAGSAVTGLVFEHLG